MIIDFLFILFIDRQFLLSHNYVRFRLNASNIYASFRDFFGVLLQIQWKKNCKTISIK